MEEPYVAKQSSRLSGDVDSSSRLEAQLGVYNAKALRAQTRLFETLDVLDEMERVHAEQLALNTRREGRLKQKMKIYAETSRKAEEEMEDMRQAVLKLIDKVEKNNGYKCLKSSQLHMSSLLEPVEPMNVNSRPVVPPDVEDLLSYAASMIDIVRRERTQERKSHQKTKEWAQSRIAVLEAQLSRRETELAHCATHCFSIRDATQAPTPFPHDESIQYQQYLDTLQWTISKNRTLELEINSLSEKLATVRCREGKRFGEPSTRLEPSLLPNDGLENDTTPTKPQPSLVSSLDQQVEQFGAIIDALKEDRRNWRAVLDSEKPQSFPTESIQRRLDAVEEECTRLRRSEEDLRLQLELAHQEEETRKSEMNQKIQDLESRITSLTINNSQPLMNDADLDTVRGPPQRRVAPEEPPCENLLDDGGEASMELATPLVPTIYLEPPTEPLEFDSPDPVPQRPSRSPSPLDLSPSPPPSPPTEPPQDQSQL